MIHRRNKNLRVVREPENPADPTDKIIEQIMDELNSEDGSMNDMEEQIKKHKIKFWRRIILSTAAVLAVAAAYIFWSIFRLTARPGLWTPMQAAARRTIVICSLRMACLSTAGMG